MPEDDEVSLYDYIRVVAKRKWLIIAGTLVCIVIAGIVSLVLPRVYETRATLTMVGSDLPDVKIGLISVPTRLSLDRFFNFLPGDADSHVKVIRGLGLDKLPDNLTPQVLSQIIGFSLAKDSGAISINVRYSHPKKARDIANAMADGVKEYYQVSNETEVSRSQGLIEQQLNLAQDTLLEAEKNLQAFKNAVDVDSLRKEIETRSALEADLAQQYPKVKMFLVEEEARLARAQEELQKQDRFYVLSGSIIEDPAYEGILAKLSREDIADLQSVKSRNQEVNPIYLDLERTITHARVSIAGAKAKELHLKARIEENRLALMELREQLAETGPEWERLTEARNLAKSDYQSIHDSYRQAAKLFAFARARHLETVGSAVVPARPTEPKTKRILFVAAVVGLLAVLFLAFFLEYLEKMRKLEAESKRQED